MTFTPTNNTKVARQDVCDTVVEGAVLDRSRYMPKVTLAAR